MSVTTLIRLTSCCVVITASGLSKSPQIVWVHLSDVELGW